MRLSMRRTPTQPPRVGARSVTDVEGFDRGTGTGEPTEPVAHMLRLMKGAGDHFNARDYAFFLEKCHHPDVIVHQIGSPTTVGHETNRAGMELVDRRVPRHAGAQRPLRHPVRPRGVDRGARQAQRHLHPTAEAEPLPGEAVVRGSGHRTPRPRARLGTDRQLNDVHLCREGSAGR